MRLACSSSIGVALLAAPLLAQQFVDVTAAAGLSGFATQTAPFGTGQAVADFDGDGDIDLVIAENSGGLLRYFRNDGGMRFSDLTASSGFGTVATVHGLNAADVDNDGDQDLFVCTWRGQAQLWINDGSAHFADEAFRRGLTHVSSNFSAAFADYDRDGWLDLYLGNRATPASAGEPNILYRNLGDGFFVDVTATAGVDHAGMTFIATFLDYDEDGWPDIVCVNDKGRQALPNEVYRNLGDGTFIPVGAAIGADVAIDGMGVDFVDVFCDGGVDMLCSDLPPDHAFLVWNPITRRYEDKTYTYGLQANAIGWAVHWMDYDNDGWTDVHIAHTASPNHLYRNPGYPASANVQWIEVGTTLGLGMAWHQSAALVADFDDDGGLDVVNSYWQQAAVQDGLSLHHNQVSRGNWIRFELEGTVSNRDGIGARIEVVHQGRRQRKWRRNGVGFLAANDPRVHFGLGSATHVDRVEITWPSGQIQYVTGLAANRTLRVVEPRCELRAPARIGRSAPIELRIPTDAGLAYAVLLSMSNTPMRLPDGRTVPVAIDDLTVAGLEPNSPILRDGHGTLDFSGLGRATLQVPSMPALVGVTIYATAVTFDPPRFALVRTLFPEAIPIRIQ